MGDKTSIEWTDATWNPLRGCTRVSDGCRNCYAEKVAARFSDPGQPYEGLATRSPARWTGVVRLIEEHLADPLRWTKPRRIFVNSMSDLFHEKVPDEWIDRVFGVMALASHHTFQVLTKRPERMRAYLNSSQTGIRVGAHLAQFAGGYASAQAQCVGIAHKLMFGALPNVHLGTSVEDQPTADLRIPELLETRAAVRFVSCEPALGPVDFGPWLGGRRCRRCLTRLTHDSGVLAECPNIECPDFGQRTPNFDASGPRLDQIIVGGESGPGARPFDVAWARSTIAQCRAAGVAVFVKQLGAQPVASIEYRFDSFEQWVNKAATHVLPDDVLLDALGRRCAIGKDFHRARDEGAFPVTINRRIPLRDRKGGNWSEWPEDLRVREFPAAAPKASA